MASTAATIIGGVLFGLGASGLLGKQQSGGNYQSSNVAYNSTQPVQTVPTEPIDVAATNAGTTNNAQMEAEREKERQAALLRQQTSGGILTSGLGASGIASTAKKGLLGG